MKLVLLRCLLYSTFILDLVFFDRFHFLLVLGNKRILLSWSACLIVVLFHNMLLLRLCLMRVFSDLFLILGRFFIEPPINWSVLLFIVFLLSYECLFDHGRFCGFILLLFNWRNSLLLFLKVLRKVYLLGILLLVHRIFGICCLSLNILKRLDINRQVFSDIWLSTSNKLSASTIERIVTLIVDLRREIVTKVLGSHVIIFLCSFKIIYESNL